ncbi:GDSL esterase/lipase At5g55050-like isoform X1 [Dioscorea cayenensis subsp. rotundata]|uniref:GDSL esterase/lipase At5g55050-like isoform X1 n=1 Tax=Dioscorea cayennensis subsp. rotundata TaxID=55577 RepID=A0AB40CHB7_DIOCR|nr:GDSL esterase/lipase At5g55050-like isoform X1 [Dioscorea cayenensis subsp. rotundata]
MNDPLNPLIYVHQLSLCYNAMGMALLTLLHVVSLVLCSSFFFDSHCVYASAPAMYVFGDSLADVGNNDYLEFTLIKADFPHNGIDYPNQKPTGRFSNGKNAADFLAERLGLPPPLPYLSIIHMFNITSTDVFLRGISFASGGAGLLDSTNKGQCLTFSKQVYNYHSVYASLVQQHGVVKTHDHLSKSIFSFIIGSNDIFSYSKSKATPQQFVDSLVSTLQTQFKRLYKLGARKFTFIGAGPTGCCPSQRAKSKTEDCNPETNLLSILYNNAAYSLLHEMKSNFGDMNYSFFDTFNTLLQYIQNPETYGFTEVKAACCGLGKMNAKVACLPISSYCSNRKKYIYWDPNHPTEATVSLLTSTVIDGSPPNVFPVNLRQLCAL